MSRIRDLVMKNMIKTPSAQGSLVFQQHVTGDISISHLSFIDLCKKKKQISFQSYLRTHIV